MADDPIIPREAQPAGQAPNPGVSGRRPAPGPVPPSMRRPSVDGQQPSPGASVRVPQTPMVVTPVATGGPARRPVYRPRGMSISTKVILAMSGLAAVIVAAMFILVGIQTRKAVNETINMSGIGYVQLMGTVGQDHSDRLTEVTFLQSLKNVVAGASTDPSAQVVVERWRALLEHYKYSEKTWAYHPSMTYISFDELIADLEWMFVAERAEMAKVPTELRTLILGPGWEALAGAKTRGARKLVDFKDQNWKAEVTGVETTFSRVMITMRPSSNVQRQKLASLASGILDHLRESSSKRLETVVGNSPEAQVAGVSYDPGIDSLAFLDQIEAGAGVVLAADQRSARLRLSVGMTADLSASAPQGTGDAKVTYREGYGTLGQTQIPIREYSSKAAGSAGQVRVLLNARELGEAQASAMTAIAIVSFVALLLAVGVAFAVGRGLTKPVRGLMDDVQEIAAGNYDHRPTVRTRDEVGTLAQLLAEMAGGLKVAQELWRTNQAQAHDLDMAREIQENLLAKNVPVADGYDISAYYQPSKEVGGDYYDFFMVDEGKIGMVVADVSGKGVPGSMIMMMAKALITYQALANRAGPKSLFSTVNKFLARDIKRGMFVTAFYVELDVTKRIARVASAGHCPMLVFREATQKPASVNPGGIALGFDKDGALFERNMKEEAIQLQSGDRVVIYTDGITEAKSPSGEEFGEQRVQQIMAQCSGYTSKDFLVQLVRAIEAHAPGTQGDDITVVTFRVL